MLDKKKWIFIPFIITLLLVSLYITFISYSTIIKLNYFPECRNYSYEERKNFLSRITYIHGTITKIDDNNIDVYVNYNPRNRWKCSEMQSPYEDYIGTSKKTYSVYIDQNTPIYSIYSPIGNRVPNDHTPRENPNPEAQIISEDQLTGISYTKQDLTIGYRVAVLSAEPILKKDKFDANLILIYPERDITYSGIIFIAIFMIIVIGGYYTIEIITNIIYYITKNKNINLVSTIIRPMILIGFFIWYFISHYI